MLRKTPLQMRPKLIAILMANFFIGLLILVNNSAHNINVWPTIPRARRHLKASQTSNHEHKQYMYIIIHYHKTGHHLTKSLTDIILSSEISGVNKRLVRWNRRTMLRSFDSKTKCPSLKFQEGIYVLSAPNFFCNEKVLAELLLSGEETSFRGLKIIHLVRNPFSMAVSNYNYHQQRPTPESWVHMYNPCQEELLDGYQYVDLLLPIISPVISKDDFRALESKCNFLFQNPERSELQTQYLYKHLRTLDPTLGVQLTTLHMLTQSVSGGDITRMASNIINFNNLKHFVSRSNALHHIANQNPNEDLIQIMSLSTDDFIRDPKFSAQRFVQFCFGDTVDNRIQENIALEYEKSYLTSKRDCHVTHTHDNVKILKDSLRSDPLFGRVLGNIETVVEQALADSRG